MVKKTRHLLIISLIPLLFFNGITVLNACPNKNPVAKTDPFTEKVSENFPGMCEIYGEVISISAREVTIDTGTGRYKFPLATQVQIYCNNLPAVWPALVPVTSEAFFEAKLFVNQQNEAVRIAGLYFGEVCVLKCWRWEKEKLYLKLWAAESGRTYWRMMAERARIPTGDWLLEDSEIYVLYNYQQNIRAVFLPD